MVVVERLERERPEAVFRALFEGHFPAVYRYVVARSEDRAGVDDVVAEVFLVAWRRIADVPAAPESLPWLLGVARRTLSDHRRRTTRRLRVLARAQRERAAAGPSDSERVRAAIAALRS